MGRFWAIGEFPLPDRRARLAQMAFSVFETAADTRYRYSGSSTNWSSRGSDAFRSESAALGGDLAVANVRSGPSHRPQCRRIFSTTSRWRRSMKLMIFILDPHWEHSSGSTSNTRFRMILASCSPSRSFSVGGVCRFFPSNADPSRPRLRLGARCVPVGGLWEGPLRTLATVRAPPKAGDSDREPVEPRELQLVLDPEYL